MKMRKTVRKKEKCDTKLEIDKIFQENLEKLTEEVMEHFTNPSQANQNIFDEMKIKKKTPLQKIKNKSINEINDMIKKYETLPYENEIYSDLYPITNFKIFQYNFKDTQKLPLDFSEKNDEMKFTMSLKKAYKNF